VITVLGAAGFIGSGLVAHLGRSDIPFQAFDRDPPRCGLSLGHVIDCVGITGDFRERPLESVEAHVGRLPALLGSASFQSFLYLSSTRLYRRATGPVREEDLLVLDPADPEDIYDLSKAAGEAVVLALGARGRVARLANVYGAGQRHSFLAALLAEAETSGSLSLRTSLDSERDYVSVEDVADVLVKIALGGRHRRYNVASGVQVSHRRLAEALAASNGWRVEVTADAPTIRFPAIDISRVRDEFGFAPRNLFDLLPVLGAVA
jgi:nucleoside-diphosphate-sugar epimerase